MEGNSLSPPAKRSMRGHKPTGFESKHSKSPPPPLAIAASQVAYRLLCHASRVAGVIGKSGTAVKLLEQQTGSKIRVEDSLRECDDRIIVVIASSSISKSIALDFAGNDLVNVSPAQEALIRVLEAILDVAAKMDGVLVAPGGIVSVRLLADTSLIGSLIGRRGKIVDKIRKDTGCKIRIFAGDKIEGSVPGVKRALIAVCSRLQDYPSSENPKTAGNRIEAASLPNPDMQLHSQRRPAIPPTPSNSAGYVSVTHHLSTEIDRLPSLTTKAEQKEVVFKYLCSNERVGGVIGKGGTIVRALENETGTSIRCAAPVSEVNERLITIAALENVESQYSPAQNATLLVFKRSVEVGIARGKDSGLGSTVTARILVPSDQVSCLLGRGGEIISGMRRTSGAAINIFASDQVPKGAPENSQIVQEAKRSTPGNGCYTTWVALLSAIHTSEFRELSLGKYIFPAGRASKFHELCPEKRISGEFVSVQDALYKVMSRLRASLFPNQIVNDVGTLSDASSEPEVSPYGHRDSAFLGMDKSVGVVNNLSQHTALTQRMDHLGLSQQQDLPPPPNLGVSQSLHGVILMTKPAGDFSKSVQICLDLVWLVKIRSWI
ncbi:K Homology domain, type 1 [Dillenia turbinata]|uniref:K Homology domain, type 1 n=1 Tax=Dillenia turbinata TaxID=194707 RepID=A0AAN8ZPZ3_9MAGN